VTTIGRGHAALPPHPWGRWAVALAVLALALVVAAAALYAVTVAVAGTDATDDNVIGMLVAVGGLAGLALSFVALVVAVIARLHHEEWPLSWLSYAAFPTLVGLVVLGEAFWWE
jgi:O-antigen/teichoic acid export membrane protein